MIFESGQTAHAVFKRSMRDPAICMSLESWVQQGYNTILGTTDEHPPRDSDLVWD